MKRQGGIKGSTLVRWLTSRQTCGVMSTIIIFVYLASLWRNMKARKSGNGAGQVGAKIGQETYLVILLQPSPVDAANQVKRLSYIDAQSWGLWIKQSPQLQPRGKVKVYAGLLPAAMVGLGGFDLIQPIALMDVEAAKNKGGNEAAYSYMLEQFLQVLLLSPSTKWMLFANDHTFLVPDNLYCFLRAHNPEVSVYSGSSLRRGVYKDINLRFASGGGGVVLSHVSLKLLLLAWILADNQRLGGYLDDVLAKAGAVCPADAFDDREMLNLAREEPPMARGDMLCALQRVRQWVKQPAPVLESRVLFISLSMQVTLTITKTRDNMMIQYQKMPSPDESHRGIVPLVKMVPFDDLRKCDATTSWDRINPGLLVAYCLQHIFPQAFVPSEDVSQGQAAPRERFNVFGSARTLAGDVDPWLTECKLNLRPGSLDKDPAERARLQQPIAVSSDLVSLHYVSHVESTLLYRALSGHAVATLDLTASTLRDLTPEGLLRQWPSTDADVGAYSRKLKGPEEAGLVLDFLRSVVVKQQCGLE